MSQRFCSGAAVLLALGGALGAGCLGSDETAVDIASAPAANAPAVERAAALPSSVDGVHLKAIPVRPPTQPGVITDGTLPVKPARSGTPFVAGPTSWSVTLSASSPTLWATQFTTLTATANMNVGPTPFFIRIRDSVNGIFIASCGSGTMCSIAVTQPNVDYRSYTAVISDAAGVEVASAFTDVYWHISGVKMTESATTVALGGSSTLTTVTDYDIGPSPFFIEIFDVTTGTRLSSCGSGTRCPPVTVSQAAATTHAYKAFLSGFDATYPPPSAQESTEAQYVTWSNSGITTVLSVPGLAFFSESVTATSSVAVSGLNLIQIYNEEGGRIASCSSGTSCTTTFTPGMNGNHLVAFVGPSSLTPPPAGAQAASYVRKTTLLP